MRASRRKQLVSRAASVTGAARARSWGNGEVYRGHFLQSKYHGHGAFTWADGRRYRGDWRLGQRSGRGELHDAAGAPLYDGEWAGDRRHGAGRAWLAGGRRFEGRFVEDRPAGGRLELEGAAGRSIECGCGCVWGCGLQTGWRLRPNRWKGREGRKSDRE